MPEKYHAGCLLAEGHASCPICDLAASDPEKYGPIIARLGGAAPRVKRRADPGKPRVPKGCASCNRPGGGDPVQLCASANGIGDQILGLCVLDGLRAKHPGRELVVVAKSWCLPWAALFGGYDRLTDRRGPGLSYDPYQSYGRQTADRLARPRWEYYADHCGVKAAPPTPRPVAPENREWAERYAGRVVLCPFSTDPLRNWSLPHWLTLERLLRDRGFDVLVADDRDDRVAGFASPKLVGESPARVGAVLHAAPCVVGNDSGMTHVAAALGTPTLALCASIRGDHVFGLYPTAKVVQGPLDCGNCHGRDRPDGAATRAALGCLQVCHDLQAITPERVLREIESLTCRRARQHTLLTDDRTASLRRAVRETAHLPGVNAELGVFRGGSALAMADAAPGKLLRLFDTFAGLPSSCPDGKHVAGEFACGIDDVKAVLAGENVEYHAGFFPDSAAGLGDERYSCVHLDGDLESTTRAALEYFWPRMTPGGRLVLDDADWEDTPGIRKALDAFFPPGAVEVSARCQALVRKSD